MWEIFLDKWCILESLRPSRNCVIDFFYPVTFGIGVDLTLGNVHWVFKMAVRALVERIGISLLVFP